MRVDNSHARDRKVLEKRRLENSMHVVIEIMNSI